MILFNYKSLLQFLPQFLISSILSVYFFFWIGQRYDSIIPSKSFIINSRGKLPPRIENNTVSFSPLHADKFREDPLLFSVVRVVDTIILWISLLLSLSKYSEIGILLPNLPFILRLLIYPAIGYLTLTSIYILSLNKIGTKELNVYLSAVIVCFLVLIFFFLPSMTWIFRINVVLRILSIYFALLTAVIVVYLIRLLQKSRIKNKIMLLSSVSVYILLVSMILVRFVTRFH